MSRRALMKELPFVLREQLFRLVAFSAANTFW
jgi:hypothetical protein